MANGFRMDIAMTFTNELEQEDDAEVYRATYQRPAYQGHLCHAESFHLQFLAHLTFLPQFITHLHIEPALRSAVRRGPNSYRHLRAEAGTPIDELG